MAFSLRAINYTCPSADR